MAVLIQRVIDADAAGVAFTANPTTEDRDQVIVSAVRGMGERLVSGEAMPDSGRCAAMTSNASARPKRLSTATMVGAVAELARAMERVLGVPEDVGGRSRTANCMVAASATDHGAS